MPHSPEYRIIRWDFELVKMRKQGKLSKSEKGEAVERILGAEINAEIVSSSGAQITTRGWIEKSGEKSSECDLIFRRDGSGGKTATPVDFDNVACIIEVKSDLKKSEIQGKTGSINEKVSNLREFTDAPIFLAGIRHDHTPEELRSVSIADETVGFGAIKHAGNVKDMSNKGEFQRLTSAIHEVLVDK